MMKLMVWVVFLAFATVGLAFARYFRLMVCFDIFSGLEVRRKQCLGPPYLYISFHGSSHGKARVNNIAKYSRFVYSLQHHSYCRDGCLLESEVLVAPPFDRHRCKTHKHQCYRYLAVSTKGG